MNTPINDAVTSADHLIDTARRLELDRAALMEAVAVSLRDSSLSPQSKVPLAIAYGNARANFPT
jgi:hypothetical protein